MLKCVQMCDHQELKKLARHMEKLSCADNFSPDAPPSPVVTTRTFFLNLKTLLYCRLRKTKRGLADFMPTARHLSPSGKRNAPPPGCKN